MSEPDSDRSEFEEALAAYRRLVKRASAVVAEPPPDDETAEPPLDPHPCP
jgi:hypothetical protein